MAARVSLLLCVTVSLPASSALLCHAANACLLSQLLHVLSAGLLPGSQCQRRTERETGPLEDGARVLASLKSGLYTWMLCNWLLHAAASLAEAAGGLCKEFLGRREQAVASAMELGGVPAWGMRRVAFRSSLWGCLCCLRRTAMCRS